VHEGFCIAIKFVVFAVKMAFYWESKNHPKLWLSALFFHASQAIVHKAIAFPPLAFMLFYKIICLQTLQAAEVYLDTLCRTLP
jgi:hypothetical protein